MPDQIANGLTGEIDRVSAELFDDRRRIFLQSGQIVLGDLNHPRVVPGPRPNRLRQLIHLFSPAIVLHSCWSHEKQIDVASGVAVAARGAAEQGGMNGWGSPRADLVSQTLNQLWTSLDHPFHNRRKQVIAIERVEEGAAGLETNDEAVLDQTVQDVLNSRAGSPGATSELPATSRQRRARKGGEDIEVHRR